MMATSFAHPGPEQRMPSGSSRHGSRAHHKLPAMPVVGLDPHEYDRQAKLAELAGDHPAHEAAKVGLYVTMALDPHLAWPEKLRYFKHAINRHCNPPSVPTDAENVFYGELAMLVRKQCGAEAVRLACKEDDFYAARLAMGQTRAQIEDDAEAFFDQLMRHDETFENPDTHCPDHFTEDDWHTLQMIRDQWI